MTEQEPRRYVLQYNSFEAGLPFMFYKYNVQPDVKLRTTDMQVKEAHKVPLAASSEYFNHKLTELQGNVLDVPVRMKLLEYILILVYEGEVDVPTNEAPEFIQAAVELHLNGLIRNP